MLSKKIKKLLYLIALIVFNLLLLNAFLKSDFEVNTELKNSSSKIPITTSKRIKDVESTQKNTRRKLEQNLFENLVTKSKNHKLEQNLFENLKTKSNNRTLKFEQNLFEKFETKLNNRTLKLEQNLFEKFETNSNNRSLKIGNRILVSKESLHRESKLQNTNNHDVVQNVDYKTNDNSKPNDINNHEETTNAVFNPNEKEPKDANHESEPDDTNGSKLKADDVRHQHSEPDDTNGNKLKQHDTNESKLKSDSTNDSKLKSDGTHESKLKADDTSHQQSEPDDTSGSKSKQHDTNESKLKPDGIHGSKIKADDASNQQSEPDDTNGSELKQHDTNGGELKGDGTNESKLKPDGTNESKLKADDATNQQSEPDDTNGSELKQHDTNGGELKADDAANQQSEPDDTNGSELKQDDTNVGELKGDDTNESKLKSYNSTQSPLKENENKQETENNKKSFGEVLRNSNPFHSARIVSRYSALTESAMNKIVNLLNVEKGAKKIDNVWKKLTYSKNFSGVGHESEVKFRFSTKEAKHIIIVASWRSGSSFLADIISQNPGTFYSFEPLYVVTYQEMVQENFSGNKSRKLTDVAFSQEILKSFYKCDFRSDGMIKFWQYVGRRQNRFIVEHNFRVWNVCKRMMPFICFVPQFNTAICPLFKTRLIKIVRLNVKYVEELMTDPEIGPNFKAIILVRDPRGVLHSRSNVEWCVKPSCYDPEKVCKTLEENLVAGLELKKKYPDKIYLIRYEDLAMDTYNEVEKLFQFLDLDLSDAVKNYLKSHTEPTEDKSMVKVIGNLVKPIINTEKLKYSTVKNSRKTALAWRWKMDPFALQSVQYVCWKQMQKLGYQLILSEDQKFDLDLPVVTNISKEIEPMTKILNVKQNG